MRTEEGLNLENRIKKKQLNDLLDRFSHELTSQKIEGEDKEILNSVVKEAMILVKQGKHLDAITLLNNKKNELRKRNK